MLHKSKNDTIMADPTGMGMVTTEEFKRIPARFDGKTAIITVDHILLVIKSTLATILLGNALIIILVAWQDRSRRKSRTRMILQSGIIDVSIGVISASLTLAPLVSDRAKPLGLVCATLNTSHFYFPVLLIVTSTILSVLRHKIRRYIARTWCQDSIINSRIRWKTRTLITFIIFTVLCILLPLLFTGDHLMPESYQVGQELCVPVWKSRLPAGVFTVYGSCLWSILASIVHMGLRHFRKLFSNAERQRSGGSDSTDDVAADMTTLCIHVLPIFIILAAVTSQKNMDSGSTPFMLLLMGSMDTVSNIYVYHFIYGELLQT